MRQKKSMLQLKFEGPSIPYSEVGIVSLKKKHDGYLSRKVTY